ncbi:MAG: hypothetical protein Q8M94_09360 [Ignavibacteria bacterium]|nr:hypothetical protein [Ignavibacteria bacterium]
MMSINKETDEIKRLINEKCHLITITKAMMGTPIYDGGISNEKAIRTIKLFEEDINDLKNKLKEHTNHKEKDSNIIIRFLNWLLILIVLVAIIVVSHLVEFPQQMR